MSEPTKPTRCVDPRCALMPSGGVGDTGACKCLDDIALPHRGESSKARRKARNALRWWQAEADRLKADLATMAERYERAMAWLEGLPDPHLSTCAIHEAGAGWEACDCGCREAMAAAPRKRGGR